VEYVQAIARLASALATAAAGEIPALVAERAAMRAELDAFRRAAGPANVILFRRPRTGRA
jgi:hypothetical protein